MPMWQLHVPEGAYTPDDKTAMANAITRIYVESAGLPRFYVTVLFHEIPAHSFLVGGEPRDTFVRVAVDHIARRFEDMAQQAGASTTAVAAMWREVCAATLAPWVAERNFDWELHTDETPLQYWFINGLTPPPAYSPQERAWARANVATPYDEVAR